MIYYHDSKFYLTEVKTVLRSDDDGNILHTKGSADLYRMIVVGDVEENRREWVPILVGPGTLIEEWDCIASIISSAIQSQQETMTALAECN
tara:strand:+ start:202 stop:474 length:273 start_codon:yes stop_codon:yes gene_type:complete